MSPRSEELMAEARRRLALAATALEAGYLAAAVSSAYYAMLYAARAALSEEDQNAKTHRGTWHLFQDVFVRPGRFDAGLAAEAARAQKAKSILGTAERFLAAVDELFAA
jgi:uncharacterized protein (UPF0332 family)